jgi:hypothetical protein
MKRTRPWLWRLLGRRWPEAVLLTALVSLATVGAWRYLGQARHLTRDREYGAPVLVVRDGYVGVIFPRDALGWGAPTEWGPTVGDVEHAEERILEFMRAKEPKLAGHLAEYVRQYFGVVAHGRRFLHCSFIHRAAESTEVPVHGIDFYLRTMGAPYVVIDGGEHYFQLLYDPETDSCSDLHVNAAS